MSGTNTTVSWSLDQSAEPFEVGAVQWFRRPGGGGHEALPTGFWFIRPQWAAEPIFGAGNVDAAAYEGRLRVEPAGQDAVELTAGGFWSIHQGVSATWAMLEPAMEFSVYSWGSSG